jgi:hypothetical protein
MKAPAQNPISFSLKFNQNNMELYMMKSTYSLITIFTIALLELIPC